MEPLSPKGTTRIPHPGRSRFPWSPGSAWENRLVVTSEAAVKLERLHRVIAATGGVVVAYSGGIDSTLVAAVAARALGERAIAVTAVSPSLAPGEADEA